jgi:hypothetical protein
LLSVFLYMNGQNMAISPGLVRLKSLRVGEIALKGRFIVKSVVK